MTLSVILSAGLWGIEAYPVHVEVDSSNGFPGWSTVGLAEGSVREAKERVLSALHNCGYALPPQKTTLNFAPADIKKQGTAFDLPVALGLLAASGLIPQAPASDTLVLGELSLNGKIRPIRGALSVALMARRLRLKSLILPYANLGEVPPMGDLPIYGAPDLPTVVEFLHGNGSLPTSLKPSPGALTSPPTLGDFYEIRGQALAKRALEIAATGFHNILLVGPPGTGKSMLAQRLPTILPPLSYEESLTTSQVYSLMGLLKPGEPLIQHRPFRAPHHTISDAGLIGGGSHPRPGEVSLAHHGVLFLDELTEFKRHVLESLRQPLETHTVTLARALKSLTFPAQFLLAAAMNPCPCGNRGHPTKSCRCTPMMVHRYQTRISGPLLDRFDLQIEVPPPHFSELSGGTEAEASQLIRERVLRGRSVQLKRYPRGNIRFNAQLGPREIRTVCRLPREAEGLLEEAIQKWGMSARAYHRVLKVTRTIADLAGKEAIETPHLLEALGYRSLDPKVLG